MRPFVVQTLKFTRDQDTRQFRVPQGDQLKDVYFYSNAPTKIEIDNVPLNAWPNTPNHTDSVDKTIYRWRWLSTAAADDYLIIVFRVYCKETDHE